MGCIDAVPGAGGTEMGSAGRRLAGSGAVRLAVKCGDPLRQAGRRNVCLLQEYGSTGSDKVITFFSVG